MLEDFVSLHRNKHNLSRFTVTYLRGMDIAPLFGDIGEDDPSLSYLRRYDAAWNREYSLAEVWCLRGVCSAFLKFGESIKYLQFMGDHDPREVMVDHHVVRLISFSLTVPDPSITPDEKYQGISVFAVAEPLVTVPQAARLYTGLKSAIGTEAVVLVIKTQPFFNAYAGPLFDSFHQPIPAPRLKSPYIVCRSEPRSDPKEKQPGCDLIKKPPRWFSGPR